jgi:hypothetical protein
MLAASLSPHDETDRRLAVKLRCEPGEEVLARLTCRTQDTLFNADSLLWVKRRGERFVRFGEMTLLQAARSLGTIAAWRSTVLNHDNPILKTELPIDGSRFEGIFSPVSGELIRRQGNRAGDARTRKRQGIWPMAYQFPIVFACWAQRLPRQDFQLPPDVSHARASLLMPDEDNSRLLVRIG